MELISTAVQFQEEKEAENRHTLGRLSIRVCSAIIYPKFRLTTVSPYAIIQCCDKRYRTKTQQNTLRPIFSDIPFELPYTIPVLENGNSKPFDCIVQIWGEGALHMTSDLIGEIIIPCSDVINCNNITENYDMKNGADITGNVTLNITFIPTENLEIFSHRIPTGRKTIEFDYLSLNGEKRERESDVYLTTDKYEQNSEEKLGDLPKFHRKTTIIENYIDNEAMKPQQHIRKRSKSTVLSPITKKNVPAEVPLRRSSSAGKINTEKLTVFAYYDVTGRPLGVANLEAGGWRASEIYRRGDRFCHLGSSRVQNTIPENDTSHVNNNI